MLGQVHREMPFMLGAACVSPDTFDLLLDHTRYDYDLFAPPNPALATVDHAIGLHASALVRDGGTLQIGIGELGDSIVYSLLLRHQQNDAWRRVLTDAGTERSATLVDALGGRAPFSTGLFGATEMFVDQMLDLYRAGILRRRVYDYLPLQRALSANGSNTRVDIGLLEGLLAAGAGPVLGARDVDELRAAGVLRSECRYQDGAILSPDGLRIEADLGNPRSARGAGRRMPGAGAQGRHGHACRLPARAARVLRRAVGVAGIRKAPVRHARRRITSTSSTAQIRSCEIAQRCHARFVNTAMMLTTLGAAVSDGLADGRVVWGVGGQYNFVAMAHALPGARSMLCARATRRKDGKLTSNIVTSYGHCTIPRHLRDIAITEYGIADLRGRTDGECVAAMIDIADSRFQEGLLARRKARQQDRCGLSHSGLAPAQHSGAAGAGLRRASARRIVLRISLRHGSHARGNRAGRRLALAQGSHRRDCRPARNHRARIADCSARRRPAAARAAALAEPKNAENG